MAYRTAVIVKVRSQDRIWKYQEVSFSSCIFTKVKLHLITANTALSTLTVLFLGTTMFMNGNFGDAEFNVR